MSSIPAVKPLPVSDMKDETLKNALDHERLAGLAALRRLENVAQSVAEDWERLQKTPEPEPLPRSNVLVQTRIPYWRLEEIAIASVMILGLILSMAVGARYLSAKTKPFEIVRSDLAPAPADFAQAVSAATPVQLEHMRLQLAQAQAEAQEARGKVSAQIQEMGALRAELEAQTARIDRLERVYADPTPTGAGSNQAWRGGVGDSSEDYALFRVENGVAEIRAPDGILHAGVGDVLPGAGKVRAIEKRDGRWFLFTKSAVIAQAR